MQTTATTTRLVHATTPTARSATRTPLRVIEAGKSLSPCELCHMNSLCLPEGLADKERSEFAAMIAHHRKVRAGEALFRAGEPFTNLYLVKTGAFKTLVLTEDGREQITGFRLAGDTLGIDAIGGSVHASDAIALEDGLVCALPFAQLSRLSRQSPQIQSYVHRLLAREVVADQSLMLLLGRMQADERVAAFLLDMSRRFEARGQSRSEFTLAMAREEIGCYLGLTLETVSRCFSRLKGGGLVSAENRHVRILDHDGLRRVIGGHGAKMH